MKKEIHTEIIINSTPEKIWSVLTNFESYAKWNPFITTLTGNVLVGNTIQVKIVPPESKGMSFKPKVITFETNKEFSWLGTVLFSGLFDGLHKFELIDNGNGTTTFKQSEQFNGLLVGLFNLDNTKKGFESMNNKLKEIAEQ
ncbi:MAG: SRPBCC domain-containing protein [Chitinophagales bacterium]